MTSSEASDPSPNRPNQDRAWEAYSARSERTGFRVATVLVILILPAWSLIDYWLERAHAVEFLAIRLGAAAIAILAALVLQRSASASAARLAMVVEVLAVGISVAYLTVVAEHTSLYMVGFSLIFWGFGLLLTWRWPLPAMCFAAIHIVHLAMWLRSAEVVPASTFLGLFAYLVSATTICIGLGIARGRLEHVAFVSGFELERRNHELAAALKTLQTAQERLVATEKLTALGSLMAQLSHEINNPVNVIQNNIEPIGDHLDSIDSVLDLSRTHTDVAARWGELDLDFVRADLRDALAAMAVAADRIHTIQNDLRAFMREGPSTPTEGDFNAGVRATVTMLRRNFGKRTELVERYGELPRARFHAGQLNQVTLNLLQNALDAIGDAGRIEVETRIDGNMLVLAISDTGPGIPEATRRRLFEPFFTTKDVGKGTGLGLATCYQIMRAHRGSIMLDENYCAGARFVVRLPRDYDTAMM